MLYYDRAETAKAAKNHITFLETLYPERDAALSLKLSTPMAPDWMAPDPKVSALGQARLV
jgi:hypothetical protein